MKSHRHWLRRSVMALLWLIFFWHVWVLGHLLWWKFFPVHSSSMMRLRQAQALAFNPTTWAAYRLQWVAYENISPALRRAVIAAEDDRFMLHSGFDWQAMRRAFSRNLRSGATLAGGSTITQQLAKNLFLSPSRSYLRKVQEALIAAMLEKLWSKQRIFEVYLNIAEWGDGVFGIGAAAQHYYALSPAALNAAQASHLAVMLPAPRAREKGLSATQKAHAARIRSRMSRSQIP